MGAKIGVLLNSGQQSQFSKVRREFDAGRVNLDPPMTCGDWSVPGNLTLLHTQTAYTRKPLHRDILGGGYLITKAIPPARIWIDKSYADNWHGRKTDSTFGHHILWCSHTHVWARSCMYTHAHTHTHTRTHECPCARSHARTHGDARTRVHAHTCTHVVHTCTHAPAMFLYS